MVKLLSFAVDNSVDVWRASKDNIPAEAGMLCILFLLEAAVVLAATPSRILSLVCVGLAHAGWRAQCHAVIKADGLFGKQVDHS
ncbi:hypothetical protein VCSRO179_3127 [Vibrio cholerae]|nr:hypothetical protein VCSRO179_3127 [Vibrio cholerae]